MLSGLVGETDPLSHGSLHRDVSVSLFHLVLSLVLHRIFILLCCQAHLPLIGTSTSLRESGSGAGSESQDIPQIPWPCQPLEQA